MLGDRNPGKWRKWGGYVLVGEGDLGWHVAVLC